MDRWAWTHLAPWLEVRRPCRPGDCSACCAVRHAAGRARRRASAASCTALPRPLGLVAVSAPHQLRHAHAVEMSRERIPLLVIQRQLGHADLAITSAYLRGIDNTEVIQAVHERPAPMVPAGQRPAPLR
jgi:integrase